jgi:hypothetical protein
MLINDKRSSLFFGGVSDEDFFLTAKPVGEALPDEGLGGVGDSRLVGKVNLGGLQNGVLLQDSGLRLVMTERLKQRKK